MFRTIPILLTVLFAILAGAPARSADISSPVGQWQTTTGESRYEVTMCGDGQQLCARLVWLRSDARTAENLQYLNTYVVRGAQPSAANQWRGTVTYQGEKVSGSVKLVNESTMTMNGCKLIMCQSVKFTRI